MARASEGNEQLLCSFCGKSQRQVKKLIAGPGVYICDECIDLCNEIIDEELTAPSTLDLDNLPRPMEIYALLNEYAQNYSTITSEQAESYIKGRAAVEESIMQLRLKYFPIFRKVLSGTATALFFQLDWRLGLIMDLQLASQTPLIEP